MHGFGFSQQSLCSPTATDGHKVGSFENKGAGAQCCSLYQGESLVLPCPTLPIELPSPPTPTFLVFLSHDHMGFWGRCLSLSLGKACKSTCGEQIVP